MPTDACSHRRGGVYPRPKPNRCSDAGGHKARPYISVSLPSPQYGIINDVMYSYLLLVISGNVIRKTIFRIGARYNFEHHSSKTNNQQLITDYPLSRFYSIMVPDSIGLWSEATSSFLVLHRFIAIIRNAQYTKT